MGRGEGIVVDHRGRAYIVGTTRSEDFPIQKPIQPNRGSGPKDAFVAKLNPAGDTLIYATYLGGSKCDIGHDIAVNTRG